MISVLVLTKNEQQDLPDCLKSVAWSDDIHVYDSGSTDDTLLVARRFGAKITLRTYCESSLAFGGDEAAHRNWGIRNIPFKYDWVFVIDADERVTRELAAAMEVMVATPGNSVAFSVRRRDFFNGTWLRYVQTSPFYIRLFRPKSIMYQRLINTALVVDGPTGKLNGFLDHFPFSKGIDHWIERHNSYSFFEARQIIANRTHDDGSNWMMAFFVRDFHQRRYNQKALFYRLPFRPLIKFLILYFGKCGFLDGRSGFTYAILQSIYEYFIVLKVNELDADKVSSL